MSLYSLADTKHTTVGRLLGTDKRRFTVKLPKLLAEQFGEETVEITEENDGMTSTEFTHWMAYYQIEADKQKKANKGRK